MKDRACVDVCPVQCIYELDVSKGVLFSEDEAGSGTVENTHAEPGRGGIFGDSLLYVNADECTSCTACYQDDVPGGGDLPEEDVPDGSPNTSYNSADPNKGHDHIHPADRDVVRRLAETFSWVSRIASSVATIARSTGSSGSGRHKDGQQT